MKRMLMAVAVMCGLAEVAPARGQFFAPPGFGGGFAYRSGFGFSFGGPGVRVTGFASRSVFAPPVLPPPGFGFGWGFNDPFFAPPPAVIVVPPPVIVFSNNAPPPIPPAEPEAKNAGNPLPPNAKPGDYLVITPKGAAQFAGGVPVPLKAPPPPAGAAVPNRPAFDPFAAPANPGNVEKVEADPTAECARLVRLARGAFAGEEYGRAVDQLNRAIKAKPAEPLPYFLKAQVRFAAGEYADAVAAIRDGMKIAPDWPASGFRPRELYGDQPEKFDLHLAELRKAVAANPDEPTLEFLLGYELWFTGDRPAAVKLFRTATKRLKDNGIVERFLLEADGKVVRR